MNENEPCFVILNAYVDMYKFSLEAIGKIDNLEQREFYFIQLNISLNILRKMLRDIESDSINNIEEQFDLASSRLIAKSSELKNFSNVSEEMSTYVLEIQESFKNMVLSELGPAEVRMTQKITMFFNEINNILDKAKIST